MVNHRHGFQQRSRKRVVTMVKVLKCSPAKYNRMKTEYLADYNKVHRPLVKSAINSIMDFLRRYGADTVIFDLDDYFSGYDRKVLWHAAQFFVWYDDGKTFYPDIDHFVRDAGDLIQMRCVQELTALGKAGA